MYGYVAKRLETPSTVMDPAFYLDLNLSKQGKNAQEPARSKLDSEASSQLSCDQDRYVSLVISLRNELKITICMKIFV